MSIFSKAVGSPFIFGLTTDQVQALKPHYNPWDFYQENIELRRALDQIRDGFFSPEDRHLFRPIFETLLGHGHDTYLLLADYAAYIACQERVSETYRHPDVWTRKSILNTNTFANLDFGLFSLKMRF